MSHAFMILIVILIITGAVGGFSSGFLGIGGGILYTPVFVSLFAYFNPTGHSNMHVAIGTSLALIVPGSLFAIFRQYRLGNIDFQLAKWWAPAVLIGAIIGAMVIRYISSFLLQIIFTAFLYIATAIILLQSKKATTIAKKINKIMLSAYACFTGFCAPLLGVGGGTIAMPFLKFFSYPYKNAVALCSLGSLLAGAVGIIFMIYIGWKVEALPHFSLGYFNWLGFVCVFPITLIFVPLGVKAANKITEQWASYLYALVLLVIAVYMTLKITMYS